MRRLALFCALLLAPAVFAQGLKLERTITVPPEANVRSAALTPKGDFIAGACKDGRVRLWTFPAGELRQAFDLQDQQVSSLQFSSDGALLAVGGNRGLVRIWSIPSGKLKHEMKVGESVNALAISPDRSLLALAPGDAPAQLWDLTIGARITELPAKFAGSSALDFSPDGQWLASADADTEIRIYESHTGAIRASSGDFLLETFAIAFSPDSKYLYAGGADKTISVIDVASGKVVRTFPKQTFAVLGLKASRDGKSLVAMYFDEKGSSNPAPVMLWDVAAQSVRITVLQPDFTANGGEFLPDGRLLLTSSSVGRLLVWSVH
jgi:WD40 repeat protein